MAGLRYRSESRAAMLVCAMGGVYPTFVGFGTVVGLGQHPTVGGSRFQVRDFADRRRAPDDRTPGGRRPPAPTAVLMTRTRPASLRPASSCSLPVASGETTGRDARASSRRER